MTAQPGPFVVHTTEEAGTSLSIVLIGQPHQMKAGHAISAAPATAPVIASAECAELLAPLMLSSNPPRRILCSTCQGNACRTCHCFVQSSVVGRWVNCVSIKTGMQLPEVRQLCQFARQVSCGKFWRECTASSVLLMQMRSECSDSGNLRF